MLDGLIGFSGGAVAVATPIIGLFEWAEKSLKRERAAELWHWLQGAGFERSVTKWPRAFVAMFDGLFGARHVTLRCFLRSSIMSFVVVCALGGIWASHATAEQFEIFRYGELRYFIPAIVMLNVIPDYISLLQTRAMLQWMCRVSRRSSLILALALDLLATIAIALILGGVLRGLFLEWLSKESFDLTAAVTARPIEMIQAFRIHGVSFEEYRGISIGVFVYSALWTSVWLWLFALASMAARATGAIGAMRIFVFRWVKVEQTPYRAIGVVATAIALFGYTVFSALSALDSLIG